MKNIFQILILFLIFIGINSCGLFDTRDPENPSSGNIIFPPATNPQILIDNFTNAFTSKSTNNYISCFSDSASGDTPTFVFVPASGSNSNVSALFQTWNISSEQRYYTGILTALPKEIFPVLTWRNANYESTTPKMVIYSADYYIKIDHNLLNQPKEFAGSVIFTIEYRQDNTWKITKWQDINSNSQIKDTWSVLKANFNN